MTDFLNEITRDQDLEQITVRARVFVVFRKQFHEMNGCVSQSVLAIEYALPLTLKRKLMRGDCICT